MATILVPYFLDEPLSDLDPPLPAATTVAAVFPDAPLWSRLGALNDDLADAVAASPAATVVLSGDCTTALGVVAGLQRRGVDPAVVWFDAHGDVQTEETTASGFLGGMPLRVLVGYRPPGDPLAPLGLRPVPEQAVLLVGARDLDPPEVTYLDGAAIRRAGVGEVAASIPDGPLYVHVDFDVVDPADLPGVRYPAPGGPSLAEVAESVATVLATGRVAALGVACTWWGNHATSDRIRPVVAAWADRLAYRNPRLSDSAVNLR